MNDQARVSTMRRQPITADPLSRQPNGGFPHRADGAFPTLNRPPFPGFFTKQELS